MQAFVTKNDWKYEKICKKNKNKSQSSIHLHEAQSKFYCKGMYYK
jgi:hypothetical protein